MNSNPDFGTEASTITDWTSRRKHQTNSSVDYNHDVQMSGVDEISKQLDDMKENLIKTSVRCHMLVVDLATQFSPYMVDTLRNVKQDCEKCILQMKLEDAKPATAE